MNEEPNYTNLEEEPRIRKLVIIMENYGIKRLKLEDIEIEFEREHKQRSREEDREEELHVRSD